MQPTYNDEHAFKTIWSSGNKFYFNSSSCRWGRRTPGMKLQSLLSLSWTFPDSSSWALVTMVATCRTFKLSKLHSSLFIQFEGLRLLVYTGFSHRKAGFPSWEGPWESVESSPKNGRRRGKKKAGFKETFFGPRRHLFRESTTPDREGMAEAGPTSSLWRQTPKQAGDLPGSQSIIMAPDFHPSLFPPCHSVNSLSTVLL